MLLFCIFFVTGDFDDVGVWRVSHDEENDDSDHASGHAACEARHVEKALHDKVNAGDDDRDDDGHDENPLPVVDDFYPRPTENATTNTILVGTVENPLQGVPRLMTMWTFHDDDDDDEFSCSDVGSELSFDLEQHDGHGNGDV